MLLVITVTLISAYLALALGTIKKFKINGFNLSIITKTLVFFLPLIIFSIHVKMFMEMFTKDRQRAIGILKMGTINYPIAVGIVIEVALESYARKKVYGDSLSHIKKEPIDLNAKALKKQKTSWINIYEKTTVNLITC